MRDLDRKQVTAGGGRGGLTDSNCSMLQCFIFRGEAHLGWDCFAQKQVSVGSSAQADLVLPSEAISDFHADIFLKNGKIAVSARHRDRKILVNNQPQQTAILGRFDYLDIGPYTVKVKLVAAQPPAGPRAVVDRRNRAGLAGETGPEPETEADRADGPETAEERAVESTGRPAAEDSVQPAPDAVSAPADTTVAPATAEGGPEADFADQPTIELDSPIDDVRPVPHPAVEEKEHEEKRAQTGTAKPKRFYPVHAENSKPGRSRKKPHPPVVKPKESAAPAGPEPDISESGRTDDSRRYRIVYQGEVDHRYSAQAIIEKLKTVLGSEESEVQWVLSDTREVVQEGLSHYDALKLAGRIESAGVRVSIEKQPVRSEAAEPPEGIPDGLAAVPQEKSPAAALLQDGEDDEEDDGEDDRGAPFALKEMIIEGYAEPVSGRVSSGIQLEVTKFKRNTIVDIFFLKAKNRYHIRSRGKKFLLAENRPDGTCLFYYDDHVWGTLQRQGAGDIRTDHLKKSENLFKKRSGLYRYSIRPGETATMTDGVFEYMIRPVREDVSPEIRLPEPEEKTFHKYMIKSSVIHLFFMIFIGFFHSVQQPVPPPPETHFVKIDPAEISKLTKKKTPPPKPVAKPKVKKSVPKKKVVQKPKKKATRVYSKEGRKKARTVVSRSPKAGGGFGRGNISNRNINQTGLLSMLGNSVGIKPQAAMAAVTNLDAVPTVHSGNAKFKVGGIVGKLGNAKIEIPKNGIVATKGSSQVLRSAGAKGVGTVAALEKGKTGQKQVQGMVSAKLNKTVRIQGGMSRAAVKRVIDQHLDEISYCYETALIANPSIMGKVIFEWKILTDGRVGMVRIKSSSINSSEIHSCIKSAIKTWQFPKPKGSEVIVSYPFVFDIVGF